MSDEIDPNQVQWDSEPTDIDPTKVVWDSPKKGRSFDVVNGKAVPTGSPEAHAAQSPTEGMSNTDLALAGAGKSQVDVWHGVRQLFGAEGAQQDVDNAAARDKPLMNTGAGIAGYIGGSIADAVIPVGLAGTAAKAAGLRGTAAALTSLANPTTYGAAAASGALQGAVQPVETGGPDRLWNTASGAASGAVGQGVARGVSAASGAITDALGDTANKAVKALTDAGVPLDAAQRTGSILLQRAKAMLSDNPLTAGAQKDFADMQKQGVTRAFLRTIGENANAATPDVMGRAMKRMGATYDDAFSRLSLPYDKVEEPLSNIVTNARLVLDDNQFGRVQRVTDDILNKASRNGGDINGEQFQNLKQTLDTLSGGADSDVGEVARDIRQALNSGIQQHAADVGDTTTAETLKKTNQQWRNMRTIEGAIDKEGDGMISPARVANIMGQKKNRSVSVYGQGDTSLSDLAQAANKLITNHVPNSGTPSRILAQAALPIAAGAVETATSDKADPDRWKKVGGAVAGAYALPKLVQMGINAQGPVAKKAIGAVGALGNRPNLPATVGGSLQHTPFATLLGIQAGMPDTAAGPEGNK